jgi:hypothetical protein
MDERWNPVCGYQNGKEKKERNCEAITVTRVAPKAFHPH